MKCEFSLRALVILANVGLSACVGSSEARRGGPLAAYAGPFIHFSDEAAAPLVTGRYHALEDGAIRIAWPGTSTTIRFHGSAVSVDITDTGANHYLVLIDGKPMREKRNPASGRNVVELVKGLPRGEHTVTLYKLNEPFVGTATIHGFVLDESAKPLPLKSTHQPRIEIIGDSISAGYGNEGDNETCGFSPETQNHFLSYGARAARELGASLTTIAWSGKGVFTNRGDPSDTATLPSLWDKALPSEGVDYSFTDAPPEAVLINLGTNDFAPEVADVSPFARRYEHFVTIVREKYPESYLFLTVGPLLSDDYPEEKRALTTVRNALSEIVSTRAEAGDARVHYLEFTRPTPEEGWGCDYHPSAKTHARMAATLVRTLREKAGF
jgi:lysophospholipase L1-like esterase